MPSRRIIAAMVAILLVSGSMLGIVAGSISESEPSINTSAVPSDGPDYGVNNSTFQRLWSEDNDKENQLDENGISENRSSRAKFASRLARSTDIPFSEPPQATEKWNQGDFGDYTHGSDDASVHPEAATLEDGVYIRDAYVSIFAVQPSTILHQGNETTQYVAPDGEVLALSDYRVAVPQDDRTGSHRERWSVSQTSIESVELSVDSRTVDVEDGHQAALTYGSLSETSRLTVEAKIVVELRRLTLECPEWDNSTSSCNGDWDRESETTDASKTVSTSRDVVVNRISDTAGQQVRFDADQNRVGAVVHPNTEWSTIAVDGDVRVRSNWWFYTAGRSGWQTMVTSTARDTSHTESSVRPVQVHAFPSQEEAYIPTELTEGGERPLAIEEAWGTEHSGPALPPNIDIAAANRYGNADSIALSSSHLDGSAFRDVTVQGIVRGQTQTVSLSDQQTVRETNLDMTVVEANATHAVIRASVTENASGKAVTTGRVAIGNQTVALNTSGIGVTTISTPSTVIRGEYTSAPWWLTDQPYAASNDVTELPANFPAFQTLIRLIVVTILWFVPVAALVFGFDYMSGGTLLGLSNRT
ncbi:hypothetical protein ACFQDG_00250 [Natronoarchaeum mannanilyticum]